MRKILWAVFLAILASCGGGGGSEEAFIGGAYTGTMSLYSDSCNSDSSQNLVIDWTVNQADTKVVLDAAPSGTVFEGHTSGSDSFLVSRRNTSGSCTMDLVVLVDNIKDNSGEAVYTGNVRCGSSTCEVAYVGHLTRRGA